MRLRRKWVLSGLAFLFGAPVFIMVAIVLIWPSLRPKADLSKVHPLARELQEPITRIAVDYYLDGGSIALEFEDATGRILRVALPVADGPSTDYPFLFFGTNYVKRLEADGRFGIATDLPEVIEVAEPRDTALHLQGLLDRYSHLDTTYIPLVLYRWRGDVRDRLIMAPERARYVILLGFDIVEDAVQRILP